MHQLDTFQSYHIFGIFDQLGKKSPRSRNEAIGLFVFFTLTEFVRHQIFHLVPHFIGFRSTSAQFNFRIIGLFSISDMTVLSDHFSTKLIFSIQVFLIGISKLKKFELITTRVEIMAENFPV